ncbi:ATP-binding protein [Polaribacter sp.]|uniref:ATP-binding protein n=1 Tax=Polaribacter sp. TaxID=1920175 RepID=UPI003F6BBA10
MKTVKLSIFLFLFCCSIYAQKKETYFQKIIDTTKNKELKLAALDSLVYNVRDQKNLDLFANRLEQYVDLAIELKQYEKAAELTIRGFYNINIKLGQREKALNLIEKIEKHIDKIENAYLIGGLYLKKGGGYFNGKDFNSAKKYYELAISNFKNKDSIHKADAIYFKGMANYELGNYKKAIDDYNLAAVYYKNLGDNDYVFYTKSEIISVYGINGFTKKTIEEGEKLINEKLAVKYYNNLVVDYFNLATNYGKLNQTKKQEEALLKAIYYNKNNKNEFDLSAQLYAGIVRFYADKDVDKAKKYLDKAAEIVKNVDKETLDYSYFKFAKAVYLFEKGYYNEAYTSSNNLLKQFKKANSIENIIKLNKLLFKIEQKRGNHRKAINYLEKSNQLKDSIYSVKKTNALTYYQTLYETEQKEKEINKQKADIVLLAKENEAKQRLIIFGSIGAALLFLIFYLYRNKQAANRKTKLQEEYSQKLLLSQEEERKRISKDLHDSLGQSLLLIKNKISLKSDDKTKELVNNAIEEMRSISRVLHPFQLEDIGISRALENLISQLDESYQNTFIFGDIDDIKNVFNQTKEVNIFRIVQECLSNVIKHAKAESAKITLIKNDTNVMLSIKDNGIGFDFSEKYNDFKSLGLKTIKERVKFLEGTLKIDSIKYEGTTFTIQFPV